MSSVLIALFEDLHVAYGSEGTEVFHGREAPSGG